MAQLTKELASWFTYVQLVTRKYGSYIHNYTGIRLARVSERSQVDVESVNQLAL